MKTNLKLIRNGSAYPLAHKNAVLATWSTTQKSANTIASEYNVSKATVKAWAHAAGLQRPIHPNVAAYHASKSAARRAAREYNTPVTNADGSITLHGRIYR